LGSEKIFADTFAGMPGSGFSEVLEYTIRKSHGFKGAKALNSNYHHLSSKRQ